MPRTPGRLRRAGRRRFVTGAKSDFPPIPLAAVTGPLSEASPPRPTAQIPMTSIETLAKGLGLLAFAWLVLAPLVDHFARRHVATDPWSATK